MRGITVSKSDPQFKQGNSLKDIQLSEVSLHTVAQTIQEFLKENYVQCHVMICTST